MFEWAVAFAKMVLLFLFCVGAAGILLFAILIARIFALAF